MSRPRIFFILCSSAWLLFAITFNLELILSSKELGDFGSFIAAGANVKNGIDPYDASSPLIFETNFPLVDAGGKQPNLNPPISLLLFSPLAGVDPHQSLNIWRVASMIIYAITILMLARVYHPDPLRMAWGVSLAGLWHTIGLGQIYIFLLSLAVMAWLSYRNKKEITAGIFLGLLISVKPNFILWLLLLALRKEVKTVLAAVVTIAVLALLPLIWFPPVVYLQWIEASNVGRSILVMPGNSSLIGLTSRMGSPTPGAILGIMLILLTGWIVFRTPINRVEPDRLNAAGIFLSLLASPITWTGYTIFAIPFFLSQMKWSRMMLVSAFILTVPFNFTMYFYYYFGTVSFIIWGWWYGIALAAGMAAILFMVRRDSAPAQYESSQISR